MANKEQKRSTREAKKPKQKKKGTGKKSALRKQPKADQRAVRARPARSIAFEQSRRAAHLRRPSVRGPRRGRRYSAARADGLAAGSSAASVTSSARSAHRKRRVLRALSGISS